MTDQGGVDQQADGGKERRRQVIEDALLAFRPRERDEFRDQIGREVPTPWQAMESLAQAELPRVLKHRLLIDAVRRAHRQDLDEPRMEEGMRNVLRSTMDEGLTDQHVAEAMRDLEAVAAAEGEERLQAAHWEEWVNRTEDLFQYSTEERTFQACNDVDRTVKATPNLQLVPSRLIVAEFWSDLLPNDFATFIDPSNWPKCSDFWKEMKELGARTTIGEGYDCEVRETVTILTGETLTVPLQIAFRKRADGSRVWTRFNLSRSSYGPNVPVDVDTGTVSAELMTDGPAPTLVRGTKYLHWANPKRPDVTTLACDFGWAELMIQMAYRCAGRMPMATTPTTARVSVEGAVKRLVEDVTTEWRNGINDSRAHLETLIGRFTGPSWDARWVNDLLALGNLAAKRSGRIASHVRTFADALKEADQQEGQRV
jgi:hypothetical protein